MKRFVPSLLVLVIASIFATTSVNVWSQEDQIKKTRSAERLRDSTPEDREKNAKTLAEKRKRPHPYAIGDVAPRLRVARWTDGKAHSLDEVRGKVVVLEFTASWCAPCRASAPIMKSVAAKYGDRVAFVGITSAEATDDEMKEWLDKDQWPPIVGVDEMDPDSDLGSTAKNYGVIGVPQIVVIDAFGRISHCDELYARTPLTPKETDLLCADISKFLGRKWPPSESDNISPEEYIAISKKLTEFRTCKFIDQALTRKRPN